VQVDRIRISSIEPNLLTHEIVEFVLGSKRFCKHFHIPLQSGSDAVLAKMRRRYRSRDYAKLVELIKTLDPDAGIGADVLVGTPGEGDKEFDETYRFIEELPLSYLHVFTYSERPNTQAIDFSDSVEPRVRARRNELLRNLSAQKRGTFNRMFLNRTLPVLFESSKVDGSQSGHTTNYVKVECLSSQPLQNTIAEVRITGAHDEICTGELITTELISAVHGELILQ